jgi:sulfate adenylyltransferase large subunit
MLETAKTAPFTLEDFLAEQESKDLLRFITCGSVDDGKSTLIGRLLYETKLLFEDQLATLERDSRRFGTQGDELDLALLLDGLAAEREQGITIDVAYRFFATERRRFIVADTPGHEQYTRNMATGASTTELAIILVDARKGLTMQTRRHSLIAAMLGIRHAVLAVNKMDLVGWSELAFQAIERDYRIFAADLGFSAIQCIPLSALTGGNIVARTRDAPWYGGPTLLDHLETVETNPASTAQPFRMPVQWVNRPNSDFRGYTGLIAGGAISVDMPVRILPSGRETRVSRILTYDGDLPSAAAGQSVTLTFADEIDVSRGDMVCEATRQAHVSDMLRARVLWMSEDALVPGRSYQLKLGTRTVNATVTMLRGRSDLGPASSISTDRLALNEIADCVLKLDQRVAFDRYADSRDTGSFIFIDRESYNTVGMGMITDAPRPASTEAKTQRRRLERIHAFAQPSERRTRSLIKSVSWRVTGSIDTVVLAFLFTGTFLTGSFKISAAIGLAELVTKVTLYYLHERIWAALPFGLRRGERT